MYKRLAKTRILRNSTISTTNLTMGLGNFGSTGLIFGQIIGQAIAAGFLGKKIWNEEKNIKHKINKVKIIALAKRYNKLPKYNLPNAIIDGFRLSGINILIAKYFTAQTLGYFSFSWKMVQTPMSLIGGSLSQVFFQKTTSVHKTKLYKIVIKFIKKAAAVSFPIFLLIYIFSPDIFSFVFGKEWRIAGVAASIMSPWLFLNFLTSPLSTLYITLNKQDVLLIFSIIYMLVPLSLIYIYKDTSFLGVLNAITIAMSVLLIIFILLILYFLKKEVK
jgi:O-antigen/teichoic acid export membrane protein